MADTNTEIRYVWLTYSKADLVALSVAVIGILVLMYFFLSPFADIAKQQREQLTYSRKLNDAERLVVYAQRLGLQRWQIACAHDLGKRGKTKAEAQARCSMNYPDLGTIEDHPF